MVKPEHGEVGTELEIQILGERKRATIVRGKPLRPGECKAQGVSALPLVERGLGEGRLA